MKTHQRVKRSSEQIRADCQMVMRNQLVPLHSRPCQENRTKKKCDGPPQAECGHLAVLDRALREPDKYAAGEQTDGIEDRKLEHVVGCRPVYVATEIKNICDDKDREDRSFRNDEPSHGDASPRRQVPYFLMLDMF